MPRAALEPLELTTPSTVRPATVDGGEARQADGSGDGSGVTTISHSHPQPHPQPFNSHLGRPCKRSSCDTTNTKKKHHCLTDLYVQALRGSLDLPLLQDASESIAATMKAAFQPDADERMLALSISPEAYRWDHRETAIVNEIMRPLRAQGESSAAGAKREADQTALKVWLVLRMGRVARGMVIAERASRNEEEPISRAKLLEKMLEFADDGKEEQRMGAAFSSSFAMLGEAIKALQAAESA